ncbi:MAG: NUDIX domain-containing protein [Candidatus Diapherotrites archaeon]|nr:NUDIX domain-containing protein [Candidatus Diapherotrites archaeon]
MKPGKDYIGVSAGFAIIDAEERLLLTKRSQNSGNEKGVWEFPGGKVHFGETLEQAIKREAFEELGVGIEILKVLGCFDHIIPEEKQHWVANSFLCKIVSGTPKIMEPEKCDGLKWQKIDEIQNSEISIISRVDLAKIKELCSSGKLVLGL